MSDPTRILFGKELAKLGAEYNFSVFNTDTKCCGLDDFEKLFPDRYHQFGICEQCMFAAAAGYSSCGEKVFVPSIGVFASMRACEQIRTFICYPNLNVTVLSTHGGLQTGGDGATHCAVEDLAIMRSIPNMTVIEPSDSISAVASVRPIVEFVGPLYVRFPKMSPTDINDADYSFKIGEPNLIREYGSDSVIFATGWILERAVRAADILRSQGIYVTVVEVHTLKPINEGRIAYFLKNCGSAVTVEDHSIIGGLGSAISEIASEFCPVPVVRIGIRDRFGESGAPDDIYAKNLMTVEDIVAAVKRVSGAEK